MVLSGGTASVGSARPALTTILVICRQMPDDLVSMRGRHHEPGHLDLFRAVLRHGGMTKAAAALGIGQPHVSRAVAQLEAELGFTLFIRGHGSATPPSRARRSRARSSAPMPGSTTCATRHVRSGNWGRDR